MTRSGNESRPGTVRRSAFERTLDLIGLDLVNGSLLPGTVCTTEDLVLRTGHSRSVVREATRVLAGMGLLTSKPHVGHVAQPEEAWDWLHPRVLRWSLASSARLATMVAIQEFRAATEPESALLAASRRSDAQALEISEASDAMMAAVAREDKAAFLDADIRVHRVIRRAAANPLLDRVGDAIDEALRDRVDRLPPGLIDTQDAALHHELAVAIVNRDVDRAYATMRQIIARAG